MKQISPELEEFLSRVAEAQATLDEGFSRLPPSPLPALGEDAAAILGEAAERLRDNYPYAHPLYAGQMLKPPHPIARAAYAMAMSVNPNNHALDGGRASSAMELEAVAALAKMYRLAAVSGPSYRAAGRLPILRRFGLRGSCRPRLGCGRVGPGALYAHADLRRAGAAVFAIRRMIRGGWTWGPGAGAEERRSRDGRGDAGDDGDRRGRSAGPDSGVAEGVWLSGACGLGLWRLLYAGAQPRS